MTQPVEDPGADRGHLIPVPIWDGIDHTAAQAHAPDPEEVAAAHALIAKLVGE